jgi:hypothetical protein
MLIRILSKVCLEIAERWFSYLSITLIAFIGVTASALILGLVYMGVII